MKEPLFNPSGEPLNTRQQLINHFILTPARNNAHHWMTAYLSEFGPRLKFASVTDQEAYQFILGEYKRIYDTEYNKVRMFPNTEKPEQELIGDIDIVYLQSYPTKKDLSTFLNNSYEVPAIAAELTRSMLLTEKLNYLQGLLNEDRFAPFRQPHAAKPRRSKSNKKPAKVGKLAPSTVFWKDVMQSEELATKVLKWLKEKGYVRIFEGRYSWVDPDSRPFQVIVALAETLHRKGYFKEPFENIHAHATINQFQSKFGPKNFAPDNRRRAIEKFGSEFSFIPDTSKI